MKIAFLVSRFPCPSETFVLNQVEGLINRGQDVDVYANAPEISSLDSSNSDEGKIRIRTVYFNVPQNKFVRLIKSFVLLYQCGPENLKILLRSLNGVKYGRAAFSLYLFYAAVAFMKNDSYDIVHCHFGPNGQTAAMLKEIGVIKGKLVTTFHGYDLSYTIKKNGNHVYNSLITHGDLYLPISGKWKDELIRFGFNAEKIIVHRMGVDLEQLSFRPRVKRQGEKIHILSIARFVEKKGLEYGIRAFARVVQKYPEIMYQIIGDGNLSSNLSQLIEQLKLGEHVQLLGWRKHAEVVKLIKEADVFLAPSITAENGDQEGIPVVLMEALAQGLPVVSTLHSGIPELVEDGVSGFLVKERDVDALADRLSYLIDYPEKWVDMGRAGRACVEAYYDNKVLNDQLLGIYRQFCHEEPTHRA